jgi:hypothetical protein
LDQSFHKERWKKEMENGQDIELLFVLFVIVVVGFDFSWAHYKSSGSWKSCSFLSQGSEWILFQLSHFFILWLLLLLLLFLIWKLYFHSLTFTHFSCEKGNGTALIRLVPYLLTKIYILKFSRIRNPYLKVLSLFHYLFFHFFLSIIRQMCELFVICAGFVSHNSCSVCCSSSRHCEEQTHSTTLESILQRFLSISISISISFHIISIHFIPQLPLRFDPIKTLNWNNNRSPQELYMDYTVLWSMKELAGSLEVCFLRFSLPFLLNKE